MLPKILRMRRELVLRPLVVLRGAVIALLAMCFPALAGAHRCAPAEPAGVPGDVWSAARYPLQCVRSVRRFGPCPGEDGKSPGRTTWCGQSRYVWMKPI